MSPVGPVLTLLREQTGEIHRRLEDRMDAVARLTTPHGRNDLVQRYHRFHRAVETAVSVFTAGLGFAEWRRTPAIEGGLTTLGLQKLSSSPLPRITNRDQALGALYVLNGSTLGGRVILKELASRGADRTGLEFLDPHGDGVGGAWRAFIVVLEREVGDPDQAAVGALAAFAHAEDILCTEVAA